MLSQLFQRCLLLSKEMASTSVSALTQAPKMLSTTTFLASTSRYDRRSSAVRQSVRQDDDQNTRRDAQNVAYEKFRVSPFPTSETFNKVFDGIAFNQLPIIHIKATSNNTIISATDSDGVVFALQSAGTVGFRNARRGTNVAAQAAAIALAGDVIRSDIKTARVCLKGIGPGRLPALKALQLSGLDVVSITDTTPLPHNGNRPKKVRRL